MESIPRQTPDPGAPQPAGFLVEAPTLDERCFFCSGELVVDADRPSELLIAMLVDRPGQTHALAHRACAEKSRGRRLP